MMNELWMHRDKTKELVTEVTIIKSRKLELGAGQRKSSNMRRVPRCARMQ